MQTRDITPVSVLSTFAVSSSTSTAVPTAVDLANYFDVGRREVQFIYNIGFGTTTLSGTANLILEECASTATASFTTILNSAGSSANFTTTANSVPVAGSFVGIVNYRYIRARYVGSTSTGDTFVIFATALPHVRNG
jgi:hypothetical protein